MGSYDRVPLLFSLLFRPPCVLVLEQKEGKKEGRRGMMARGSCGQRSTRDEMNRDQGRARWSPSSK